MKIDKINKLSNKQINNMTKLEIFNKLMTIAKNNGYEGPDGLYNGQHIGAIMDGTNIYSIFFREDFARAVWGSDESTQSFGIKSHKSSKKVQKWELALVKMVVEKDKWKFIEDNIDFD